MRNTNLALVSLFLLVLLATCGGPLELVTTVEPTTETGTTASVTTTEKQIDETGENWRRIDLEANEELHELLAAQIKRPGNEEYKLSDSKTLFEQRGEYGARTIWLRDEQSGKETELIDPNADNQDSAYYIAYIQKVLNERYFVYGTAVMDSDVSWDGMIFDVQRGKTLPVVFSEGIHAYFRFAQDGILYYQAGDFEAPISVFTLKLADFDAAETLAVGENLLRDVPEANEVFEIQNLYADPGSHYLFVAEPSALRVFDLREKSFVMRVVLGDDFYFHHRAMKIGDALYLYGVDWETYEIERYALEIPLP